MKPIENILLTTDFSDLAREAYPAAAKAAAEFKARIHLVHEAESLSPVFADFKHRSHFQKLSECLEREAEHPDLLGRTVNTRLLHEWTRDEKLVEYARNQQIDLIMQSTHGRSGLAHIFLGSFAEKTARTSEVPVLTYRRRKGAAEPLEIRSVLVPYDFSENACVAFPAACFLADRYGASVNLLNVQRSPEEYLYPYVGLAAGDDKSLVSSEERRAHVKEALKSVVREELGGVKVAPEVVSGDPWSGIVASAESLGVDLIVMGTHGWTGMQHWLLGSVAEKVIRHAPCSVLTMRPRAIRNGARQEARSAAGGSHVVPRRVSAWFLADHQG